MPGRHSSFCARLIGSWDLIYYQATSTTDPTDVIYPLGNTCRGRAIFSTDGYVSAHIQSSDVQPYSEGRLHANAQELADAAKRTLTYTGKYRLEETAAVENSKDVQKATIFYDVDISLPPNWIGITEVRELEMVDDRDGETLLYLRPQLTMEMAGVERQVVVKTRRARDNSEAVRVTDEKGRL